MSSIKIKGRFSGGFDLITFPPNVWVVSKRISVTDTIVAVTLFNRFSFSADLFFIVFIERPSIERPAMCAKKIACWLSFVTAEILLRAGA